MFKKTPAKREIPNNVDTVESCDSGIQNDEPATSETDAPNAKKSKIMIVSRPVQTNEKDHKSVSYMTTVPFDWNSIGLLNWGNLYNKVLQDLYEVYRLCFSVKLLPVETFCDQCGTTCRDLRFKAGVGRKTLLRFECKQCRANNIGKVTSLQKGTIFENCNITLGQVLGLAYWFVYDSDKVNEAIRECSFDCDHPIGWSTAKAYFSFFTDVCCEKVRDETYIGGLGCTVEVKEYPRIDLSTKCQTKNNSAKSQAKILESAQLIVIGVCRESGEAFAIKNEDKTAKNLLKMIMQFVQPDTTVVMHCERFFDELSPNEWFDITAGSKLNFKEALLATDLVNTSPVWVELQRFLYSNRLNKLDHILGTYMWKRNYNKMNLNLYKLFLQHIAEIQKSRVNIPKAGLKY